MAKNTKGLRLQVTVLTAGPFVFVLVFHPFATQQGNI